MDAEQFEVLSQKLDRIILLLTRMALEGKTKVESTVFLKGLGFGNTQIASLVGSTPKAVSVRLAEAKKPRVRKAKVANVEEASPEVV